MKNQSNRRLAAIMFTDIEGYTALMEQDEQAAMKVRAKHREVFETQHKQYLGEVVQYFGDGTLSMFQSGVEAVKCAIAIQKKLNEGDPVPLRIGLHLGDIVFDGTEIYGDGVNYASRIESMSASGSVLVSGRLNEELKNQTAISTVSLGQFELKNKEQPVEVFAVSNEGLVVPKPSELKGKQKPLHRTLAVLPFANMSASEDDEYFSDGITEEIINALARIKSLKVTSRTSSFYFKNKNVPIKEIAKELGASVIIEGSVRRSGNIVRITAQLIQAQDDFHFWSETWDRNLENIFEVQDEISLIIADKLREQFGHLEISEHLVSKKTEDLKAYEFCLKAKFHSNKWNAEDVKTAITHYENALECDSNYAEAFLGLANCYGFLGTIGFMSFGEAWAKTMEYTNQALELEDQSSGVQYQLANHAFFVESDFGKSLQEIKKAIALNPNNAEAQQFISFLHIISGEKEKSNEHLEIALSINPLSEETQFFKAYFHYMAGDYAESLVLLDKCLSANDKNIPAHSVKPLCLLKLGRYDDALHYFDNIPDEMVVLGEKTGAIGLAYALLKDSENAALYLEKLTIQSGEANGFTADSYLFFMYVANGDYEKAFKWISHAINNNAFMLLLRFADPLVNEIKDDPRYREFQQQLFPLNHKAEIADKKKVLLDEELVSVYSSRLLDHLTENAPYLDSDLSLRSLADQIDIHPNQLSWLLNERFNKNFNEFINHYRIEAFKRLSKEPEKAHITIIGLAYESGFSSKTVFNTYFKKETGLTPKQYMKLES